MTLIAHRVTEKNKDYLWGLFDKNDPAVNWDSGFHSLIVGWWLLLEKRTNLIADQISNEKFWDVYVPVGAPDETSLEVELKEDKDAVLYSITSTNNALANTLARVALMPFGADIEDDIALEVYQIKEQFKTRVVIDINDRYLIALPTPIEYMAVIPPPKPSDFELVSDAWKYIIDLTVNRIEVSAGDNLVSWITWAEELHTDIKSLLAMKADPVRQLKVLKQTARTNERFHLAYLITRLEAVLLEEGIENKETLLKLYQEFLRRDI